MLPRNSITGVVHTRATFDDRKKLTILKSVPALNPKCDRMAGNSKCGSPEDFPLEFRVLGCLHLIFFVRYVFRPAVGKSDPGPPIAQMY